MTVLMSIAAIVSLIVNAGAIFAWLKRRRGIVENFIKALRRKSGWYIYLFIATIITIFFLVVLSMIFALVPFSISIATLTVLIIWGLIGTWSIALQGLHSKRVDIALEIAHVSLATLAVTGFWLVKWPEIVAPLTVTLLLFVAIAVYVIDAFIKRRKAHRINSQSPRKASTNPRI